MGQKLLIYSFVARRTMILAEYAEFKGNFTRIAAQCLENLSGSNNKFSFNCDGRTFNYLVEDGYTFCVVAVESVDREIPIFFLERVKEEFNKRYGGNAATAAAKSLSREFGSKLKEHMQYCADHPEEISKMAKLQAQVLDNKETVDVLVEKAKNLYSQAQDFRLQGTTVRRNPWLQDMKIMLIVIVLGIIIALILIIVLTICLGNKC
ncbi:vesicle-associated membrane protein 725-like isoform X2 [Musa acuminata AAA Group]|uniref:vesicle-associated membrane protein 725-like isoform X2 n=1 Tax=Musa acuminata AAA Group TaxID=214697 RepID=UPI0031D33BE6